MTSCCSSQDIRGNDNLLTLTAFANLVHAGTVTFSYNAAFVGPLSAFSSLETATSVVIEGLRRWHVSFVVCCSIVGSCLGCRMTERREWGIASRGWPCVCLGGLLLCHCWLPMLRFLTRCGGVVWLSRDLPLLRRKRRDRFVFDAVPGQCDVNGH